MKRTGLLIMKTMLIMMLMNNYVFCQTLLVPGDIAITGVNMDNPDEFSVVFLVDVQSGTEIRFTDNGWKADSTFRTGEGIDIWIANQDYDAGDEIIITPESMVLSSEGDQILAYQGDGTDPQFITALNNEGDHVWQSDATNSNTSALPLGLIDGYTCVALQETDNIIYNRIDTTGTREELLAVINAFTNWAGSNTVRQTLSTIGYVVTVFGGQFPDRLKIISINNGYHPVVDLGFDVVIQAEDSLSTPLPVQQNTIISLTKVAGSGTLDGPLSDTMYAGSSSVTLAGVLYDVAESNVTIMAAVVTGDGLDSDTSEWFKVITLPDIVMNEIHYNGPETGEDTTEFLEMYNAGIDTVELQDYSFTQGISFIFPPQSSVCPGEFIILAKQENIYSGQGYQVFEWSGGTLENGGETLEFTDPMGHLIDQVTYGNNDEWGNGAPDGYGPSLELNDPEMDNSLSVNWRASYNNGGTPGGPNSEPPLSAQWYGGTPGQEHNWAVPSNWQLQVAAGPTSDVTILSPTDEILIVDNNFSCNDLIMNPGAHLTVASGFTLTVNGDLLLESDSTGCASLMLQDNSAVVEVLGATYMQQYLTGGVVKDPDNAVYHYLSSPVIAAVAGDVFPGSAYVRRYNEPAQVWENLTSTDILEVMKGYSVWLEGGSSTVSFEGTLNTGDQMFDNMIFTDPGIPNYNPDYAGYNLVGNPFPSGINWEHPDVVKTNIDDAIYFWNPELGGYSSYIDGIGNNPETTDSIIPPLQGFFVRVSQIGNSGSLAMNNSVRLHDAGAFYKSVQPDVLRVSVTDGSVQDQTTIRYKSSSTPGFDCFYDAFKLFGSAGTPQIYSLSNENKMSINTLPSIDENGAVPIGFYADQSETYCISVSGTDSFIPEISISLEDLKENIIIDCRLQPAYEFDYELGENENRFIIHFTSASSTVENPEDGVTMHNFGKVLYLCPSVDQKVKEVYVYNLAGSLIMHLCPEVSGIIPVRMVGTQTVYIVRVVTEQSIYTKKIMIN
ncbi:MAG: lamin tail domain-containing protein [Bacteroidetes bacterium]|nr:lamin tail domain-containing protein [Bacteroidota bacterium]